MNPYLYTQKSTRLRMFLQALKRQNRLKTRIEYFCLILGKDENKQRASKRICMHLHNLFAMTHRII